MDSFVIVLPYVWLFLFFFIPFLLIFKISFSQVIVSMPPFGPVVEWLGDQVLHVHLNLKNYSVLFTDPFYGAAFVSSVGIASASTVCCLILGYMMAYGISRANERLRPILLLFVVLPFWTSFLIRVYAWLSLLSSQGIVNSLLMWLGVIDQPLVLLDNSYAVCAGIVYCYLPFMILPIYAALEKIDSSYIEAAFDLGCTPWRAFWSITVPLSKKGVLAGCVLVFIPTIGEFVIPEILGGPDTVTIGRVLWWEFFNNRDWPLACALAVTMVLLFIAPIMAFQRHRLRDNEEGGY
ncbi:MAG: ABC transporter permease subunit [Alphaproteobacteria bacterium]|nr:ABC transporter permease subunit [Alphaproteobacteria bacterium]